MSTRREDNRIQLQFDVTFWSAYQSVLEQAVALLNARTGAGVQLETTTQHLGGMQDPHTGLYHRVYYHLRLPDVGSTVWTVPIALYTPEILAQWFEEKLGLRPLPRPPRAELPQPKVPVGAYLGENFYGLAAGDRLPIGSWYVDPETRAKFEKVRRSPFDFRGAWRKED